MNKNTKQWLVYMIFCSDDSYYTGITNDLEQRFQQHETGQGAKYFRGRKPKKVVYTELMENRSEATKREAEIKKLSRAQKILLIDAHAKDRLCKIRVSK